MDLLPDPVDPSCPTEPAPYVCDNHWDGGSFLSFPKRVGKVGWIPFYVRDRFLPELSSEEPWVEDAHPAPPEEKEPFFQRWLFFGLIAEFLGFNELDDGTSAIDRQTALQEIAALHKTYTKEKDGKVILTGLPLLERIQERLSAIKATASDVSTHMNHLFRCITLTWMLIRQKMAINPCVKYSICALGEVLSCTTTEAIQNGKMGITLNKLSSGSWKRDYISSFDGLAEQMISAGWCKSDIMKAEDLYDLSTIHYLSRLKRPFPGRDHSLCSSSACTSSQISPDNYSPAHLTDGCSCSDVEVDMSKIKSILRDDNIYPVIKLNRDKENGEMELTIEKYSPGVPYVALSHVWADGLGNVSENTLPECQIAGLFDSLRDIRRRVTLASENKDPYAHALDVYDKDENYTGEAYRLWVDTLCCPLESETKKLALRKMADVYRNATHVLVLDAAIKPYKARESPLAELNLRIWASSTWMRRLWTLQEGALAKSIWFLFSDMAVRMYDITQALTIVKNQDARYWNICEDLISERNRIQSFLTGGASGPTTGSKMPPLSLYYVQRTLYFRNVSVPSDEPVCLSTLLGLDTNYVLEEEDTEGRMIRLWQMILQKYHSLPASFVFSLDDTCQRPGWRWAPRSILNPKSYTNDDFEEKGLRFMENDTWNPELELPKGKVSSHGFNVRLPGYLIRTKSRQSNTIFSELFKDFLGSRDDRVLYESNDGRGLSKISDQRSAEDLKSPGAMVKYPGQLEILLHEEITSRKCAVIPHPRYHQQQFRSGILVEIIKEVQGDEGPLKGGKEASYQVRPLREVAFSEAHQSIAAVFQRIDAMATQAIAGLEESWLSEGKPVTGEYREEIRADLKRRMQDLMKEALLDREFEEMFLNTWNYDIQEAWQAIGRDYFRYVELTELPAEQGWYFD